MAVYVISYDLKYPIRDYPKVEKAIKSLGPAIKPLNTFWLLDTSLDTIQIRDKIFGAFDPDDKFLIVPTKFGASGKKIDSTHWSWIETHLK